jgi:hypothetical protein
MTNGFWAVESASLEPLVGVSIDSETGELSINNNASTCSFFVGFSKSGYVPQTPLQVTLTVSEAPLPPITEYTVLGPTTLTATTRVANSYVAEYYAMDNNDMLATGGT